MSAAVLIGAACVAVIGVFFAVLRWENRRDDRREQLAAESRAALAWLMRARYGNTWGAQQIRASLTAVRAIIAVADPDSNPWEPPKTSPAPPPARAPRAPAPGDEAAGSTNPPGSPPPLPTDDDLAALARAAVDTPGSEPFPVWQLDAFVEKYNAITGGAS